jgi:hypothetical protein
VETKEGALEESGACIIINFYLIRRLFSGGLDEFSAPQPQANSLPK